MSNSLVTPSLLFEFSIEIRRFTPINMSKAQKSNAKKKPAAALAGSEGDWKLGEKFLIPDFNALTGKPKRGTVAVAWSDEGLYFESEIPGKKQPPRFIGEIGGVSDGLRVWIDTRNSPNVHRATRFCHCFHFFPGLPNQIDNDTIGSDSSGKPSKRMSASKNKPEAFAPARGILDEVARAREQPNPINPNLLSVRSILKADGYSLNAFIPAECLTGYLPSEFDRIRIFYDLVDAELGTQSQSLSPELRYSEDPSLWIEAKLTP